MNDFVLPDPIVSQLQGFPCPVNLFDSSGKKVGCFVPAIDPTQYEVVGPELTEAELREASQSTEWYSTDEVLSHLEKLR